MLSVRSFVLHVLVCVSFVYQGLAATCDLALPGLLILPFFKIAIDHFALFHQSVCDNKCFAVMCHI